MYVSGNSVREDVLEMSVSHKAGSSPFFSVLN